MENKEERILARLESAILAMLREYEIAEPVYGVTVVDSTEPGEELAPWIAVGTDRERRAFQKGDPAHMEELLWDGEALEIYDPVESVLEDLEFLDLCADWCLNARSGDHAEDKVTALMQRLCFRLQKADWRAVFPVTADFVVTACGKNGDWLHENMGVLLEPARLDDLYDNHYLCEDGCGEEEFPS